MELLIIDSFTRIVESLNNTLSGGALSVGNMARYLVCIGIFFKIARSFIMSTPDSPIEWQILIRPILVIIILGIYPQIMKGMNVIFTAINDGTSLMVNRVSVGGKNPVIILDEKLQKESGGNQPVRSNPSETEKNGYDKISSQIPREDADILEKGFLTVVAETARDMVKTVIIEVLKPVAAVIGDCYKLVAAIILSLLFVGGPLAIGLSCLPGFEESLPSWIVAYVSIALWPFVVNIIMYIFLQFTADNSISMFGSISGMQAYGIIFFYLGIIMSVLMVPTISKYFIASTGAGALLQKGGRMASVAIRAAVAAV